MTPDDQSDHDAMTRLLERAAAGVGEPNWDPDDLQRRAGRIRTTRRATAAAAAAIVLVVGAAVPATLLAGRSEDKFGYLDSGQDRPVRPVDEEFRPKEPSGECGQVFPVTDAQSALTARAAVGGPFDPLSRPADTDVKIFVIRIQAARSMLGGAIEVVLGGETEREATMETHQFEGRLTLLDKAGRVIAGYPSNFGVNMSASLPHLQPKTPRILGLYMLWSCDLKPGIPHGAKYVRIVTRGESKISGTLTLP